MKNGYSKKEAADFVARHSARWGEDLALRTYTSRLLGAERSLVLHGGGNTSVKSTRTDLLGEQIAAIFVKASGWDMAAIEPEGHAGLDLEYLKKLRKLESLSDEAMVNEFRTHLFDHTSPSPSIETLVHAFIPKKYVDHTHADAILALTNQPGGEKIVREAFGDGVIIVDYVKAGFRLAKAAAEAFESSPRAQGMVLMQHGIITWGGSAKESYEAMIAMVSKAERHLEEKAARPLKVKSPTRPETARERVRQVAPLIRGLVSPKSGSADNPFRRMVLTPLTDRTVLDFVDSDRGKEMALSPTITSDHLIRTKALPLWIDSPEYDDFDKLRAHLAEAVSRYAKEYEAYFDRNRSRLAPGLQAFDPLPRVILLPGLGALCVGRDAAAAQIVRDITAQTLAVKAKIAAMGTYRGLPEADLFDMEYYALQHAKLAGEKEPVLAGSVAVVTGAAGAIGSGICRGLLDNGCHVAVTDLPGEHLDGLVDELRSRFGGHVIGVPLDVTDPASVSRGFGDVAEVWGGVDLIVVNAGMALVSSLAEMDVEAFRRLERVNVEGTLLLLREAAGHFRTQATGGDIVAVSTKNVFAPGAKFGAYSATKAASHQLARIASLELADAGVRVNMVSPDAVFSDGARKSGLWQEVGPDRMRARGLDEKGLEEYYRNRNLLKAKITAEHVANAVLYFATRQTPTTGATIPVDGGLPDATPR